MLHEKLLTCTWGGKAVIVGFDLRRRAPTSTSLVDFTEERLACGHSCLALRVQTPKHAQIVFVR